MFATAHPWAAPFGSSGSLLESVDAYPENFFQQPAGPASSGPRPPRRRARWSPSPEAALPHLQAAFGSSGAPWGGGVSRTPVGMTPGGVPWYGSNMVHAQPRAPRRTFPHGYVPWPCYLAGPTPLYYAYDDAEDDVPGDGYQEYDGDYEYCRPPHDPLRAYASAVRQHPRDGPATATAPSTSPFPPAPQQAEQQQGRRQQQQQQQPATSNSTSGSGRYVLVTPDGRIYAIGSTKQEQKRDQQPACRPAARDSVAAAAGPNTPTSLQQFGAHSRAAQQPSSSHAAAAPQHVPVRVVAHAGAGEARPVPVYRSCDSAGATSSGSSMERQPSFALVPRPSLELSLSRGPSGVLPPPAASAQASSSAAVRKAAQPQPRSGASPAAAPAPAAAAAAAAAASTPFAKVPAGRAAAATPSMTKLSMTKPAAARLIQRLWRGWRLRRHADALRALAATNRRLCEACTRFYSYMGATHGSITHKQLLEINELAMGALLRLDSLEGLPVELRALKKHLTGRALQLQDQAQEAYARPTAAATGATSTSSAAAPAPAAATAPTPAIAPHDDAAPSPTAAGAAFAAVGGDDVAATVVVTSSVPSGVAVAGYPVAELAVLSAEEAGAAPSPSSLERQASSSAASPPPPTRVSSLDLDAARLATAQAAAALDALPLAPALRVQCHSAAAVATSPDAPASPAAGGNRTSNIASTEGGGVSCGSYGNGSYPVEDEGKDATGDEGQRRLQESSSAAASPRTVAATPANSCALSATATEGSHEQQQQQAVRVVIVVQEAVMKAPMAETSTQTD